MTDLKLAKAREKAADEKLTPIIAYTANAFIKGEAFTKENIRVSTWLRTQAMPEYVHLTNAQLLIFGGGAPQPASYHELMIPTSTILAYHMIPPAKDPLDYDEAEANRKLEPCTALVGVFKIQGSMRMAAHLHLVNNLEINRTSFTSFYDVEINTHAIPNMGTMRVPMVLLRANQVMFGIKTS